MKRFCCRVLALGVACLLLVSLGVSGVCAETQDREEGPYLVGYFPYYTADAQEFLSRLDASLLTHIVYAFGYLDDNMEVYFQEPEKDAENFALLRQLRETHGTQILLAIGGAGAAERFPMSADPETRARFVRSCVETVKTYDLDGIDLDWEYPETPEAVDWYVKLLSDLRKGLDALSRENGRKYWVTTASNARLLRVEEDSLARVAREVDYIFLMCYDIHGGWEKKTDFNAPLYSPESGSPTSVYSQVTDCLRSGLPSEKIVLGMPLYGRVYEEVRGGENGWRGSFASAWELGFDDVRKTYFADRDFVRRRHPETQVPWLFDGETFVSYEDARSLAAKTELVHHLDLAGAGVWALLHDSGGSLLSAIWATLQGGN